MFYLNTIDRYKKHCKMITPLTNADLILFCTCRRISPLKKSRQGRRMMTIMETIYSKTAMTVS